jgi:hypothetical protein
MAWQKPFLEKSEPIWRDMKTLLRVGELVARHQPLSNGDHDALAKSVTNSPAYNPSVQTDSPFACEQFQIEDISQHRSEKSTQKMLMS